MGQSSQQFDSSMQVVLFNQFLQVDHPLSISSDNKVDVLELC